MLRCAQHLLPESDEWGASRTGAAIGAALAVTGVPWILQNEPMRVTAAVSGGCPSTLQCEGGLTFSTMAWCSDVLRRISVLVTVSFAIDASWICSSALGQHTRDASVCLPTDMQIALDGVQHAKV